MKRLLCDYEATADAIINKTVLDFYGLKCNEKRDISDIDKDTAYAIRQALIFTIGNKFPKEKEIRKNKFVNCIIRYVLHLAPEVAGKLTVGASARAWEWVVEAITKNLTQQYAGSPQPNEILYRVITERLLGRLEWLFFGYVENEGPRAASGMK